MPRTSTSTAGVCATSDCTADAAACSIKNMQRQASIPVASDVFRRIVLGAIYVIFVSIFAEAFQCALAKAEKCGGRLIPAGVVWR